MPRTPPQPRTQWTFADWEAEGTRRFGVDRLRWRFLCPACGHSQAVEDFRPFKSEGVTADTARFNCIGRYVGPKRKAFGGTGPGPCDFTGGGLLDIRPWMVVDSEGKPHRSFAFSPALADRP